MLFRSEAVFSGTGERFRFAPWGLFGGKDGKPGRFQRREPDGKLTLLDNKPAEVTLTPNQAVVMETPGSGGYGDPSKRPAEAIERDAASGKFSSDYLRRAYPKG